MFLTRDLVLKEMHSPGFHLTWKNINFMFPYRTSIPSLRTLPYGVLQGSCAGPIAFTAYSSTLETVVHKIRENNGSDSTDSIILNGFADDHSLSKAFCPDTNEAKENTIKILEHGLYDISHWMTMNCLKMNPTKTDFIYLGSRVQVAKCLEETISVCGDNIEA